MTQNPDNPAVKEHMIGRVVRVVEDGSSWGPRAYNETNVVITLCANGQYDPDNVREAIIEALDRGLIQAFDDRLIPGEGYEEYMRPNAIDVEQINE